jgi:glycosyltransferase involved in cell wall biosynthesis
MQISVVTISYNQARFLERAIRSVLEQDHSEVEYIVVDPGSTDGSREILERYRSRISRLVLEPDQGPADGLNKGFRLATGDVFGYLNSDDAYLPGALRRIAAAFAAHPDSDVIYGHGYVVDDQGRTLRRFYSDRFSSWRFAHGGCFVMQPSTFFRRTAYQRTSGFNPDNRIWWDAELLIDLSLTGARMRLIEAFLSAFTLHDQSISAQKYLRTPLAQALDIERHRTRARLFEKAMGRPPDRWTAISMWLARIQKRLLQPKGSLWSVLERAVLRRGRIEIHRQHSPDAS